MSIKVYNLKNHIVESSVDEYLLEKEEVEEYKNSAKQISEEESGEKKQKKELRTVFISTSDTAREAMSIAGVDYEGEIYLETIEFCKIECQQKCICGNLHIPKLNSVLGDKINMYFFANHKNIVFIDDVGFANKIMKRVMSSRTKPGQSRERFLYNFCVNFMNQDLENLGRYEKRIMKLEEEVYEGDLEDVTSTIAHLRKELLILREYYDELGDVGKQLEENENNFFSGDNLVYFGTISDRADRLLGRTMYLLDYIGQVRDTYNGIVAERQNDNMRFLTIISTIFLPLTLIVGWYGMNFQNMPELENGYPYVIALSLAVIAIVIFIFKKRKIF